MWPTAALFLIHTISSTESNFIHWVVDLLIGYNRTGTCCHSWRLRLCIRAFISPLNTVFNMDQEHKIQSFLELNNALISWLLTYSSTQCPAVATQYSFNRAPPQRWVDEPKMLRNEVRRTDTWVKIKVVLALPNTCVSQTPVMIEVQYC